MSARLLPAIAGLLALGFLIAPRPPSRQRIDPDLLLGQVLQVRGVARSHLGALVVRNYVPLVEGEDVVSNRQTWVLRLKPRVKKRPWMQLWIDKKTFVALASRCWDWRNRLTRSGQICNLTRSGNLGICDSRSDASVAITDRRIAPGGQIANPAPTLRPPSYIPSGYELLDVCSFEQGKLTQLVYSDGLFVISVFKRFPGRPGREHTETRSAYAWEAGSVLLRRGADGDVIVIADLPLTELGRIADSVRNRGTVR